MWREKDTLKTFADSELIVEEGDEGTEMFIICSGEVRVTRRTEHGEVELAHLGKGEFFGEMSLLENEPRSATVTSVGKTQVMILNLGNFMLKIKRDPSFAFSLMQKMSRRVRVLNEELLTILRNSSQEALHAKITRSEFQHVESSES